MNNFRIKLFRIGLFVLLLPYICASRSDMNDFKHYLNFWNSCSSLRIRWDFRPEYLEISCPHSNFNESSAQLKEKRFVYSPPRNVRSVETEFRQERINFLKLLPFILQNTRDLEELDISDNQLEELPPGLFCGLKNLRVLRLAGNQLTRISKDLFADLTSLEELDASNNFFEDFHMDTFKNLENVVSINLSYNNLKLTNSLERGYSPFENCIKLKTLNLAKNSLTTIFRDWTSNFHELELLDLSDNRIQVLTSKDFILSSKNLVTDLSNNLVNTINIAELNTNNADGVVNSIILNGNPINCNCRDSRAKVTKILKNEYQSTYTKPCEMVFPESKISSSTNCKCQYDRKDGSTSITINCPPQITQEYDPSTIIRAPPTSCLNSWAMIIALLVVISIILAIMIGLVLYRIYKIEIKVWTLVHGLWPRLASEEVMDKDKPLDAFICFADDDRSFVDGKLLPLLQKIGLVREKVFIPEEFLPDNSYSSPSHKNIEQYEFDTLLNNCFINESIRSQIMAAIESSRRIIVVVSPHLVASAWTQLLFRVAFVQTSEDRCSRIIVVLKNQIDPEKVIPELKAYITTGCYFIWGDPSIESKLKRKLPRYKIRPPQIV